MKESANQPRQIASEHQFVQMQVGFVKVPAAEFDKVWNGGDPNLIMKPISGVKGPCNEDYPKIRLDDDMLVQLQKMSDVVTCKMSYDANDGKIAIAKSFDDRKKYAIGVLEYKVVSFEE